ncbi:MAG: hypothetical protein KDA96_17890, partial [Planctomycetaceae bacterium]|nr:hypothetical protein [Planctomycetaceae bacterium]
AKTTAFGSPLSALAEHAGHNAVTGPRLSDAPGAGASGHRNSPGSKRDPHLLDLTEAMLCNPVLFTAAAQK